jgi:hypothetical protein
VPPVSTTASTPSLTTTVASPVQTPTSATVSATAPAVTLPGAPASTNLPTAPPSASRPKASRAAPSPAATSAGAYSPVSGKASASIATVPADPLAARSRSGLLRPIGGALTERRLVTLPAGVVLGSLSLQRTRTQGKLSVRLKFVLSGPARVTFLVFGPGQSCNLAGRFTIAAHRGLNRIVFRGRVQNHALRPGTYRLVPKAQGNPAPESLPAIGIVVNRDGVRPATPPAWPDCNRKPGLGTVSNLVPERSSGGVGGVAVMQPPRRPVEPVTDARPHNSRSQVSGFLLGESGSVLRVAWRLGLGILFALSAGFALARLFLRRAGD